MVQKGYKVNLYSLPNVIIRTNVHKFTPAMLVTSGSMTETCKEASMFGILTQKRSGIYCYENLVNGRKYVGQSIDIERRAAEHERHFKNKKRGEENPELFDDVLKYGRKKFKFYVVCYCHPDQLDDLERFHIRALGAHISDGGYNVLWGGDDVPNLRGRKLSASHVENIRKSKIGSLNPFFGVKHSEEARKKMSKNRSAEKNHLFGKKSPGCSSSYYGVHFIKVKSHGQWVDYWEAAVSGGRGKVYIGRFRNEIDAAKAYDRYVIENYLSNPLNFAEGE